MNFNILQKLEKNILSMRKLTEMPQVTDKLYYTRLYWVHFSKSCNLAHNFSSEGHTYVDVDVNHTVFEK